MTANKRDAKPDIHANRRMVNVRSELKPAAFVNVEDFICFDDGFLSGNMTFLLYDEDAVLVCIFNV